MALYLIATPIGNKNDLSLRGLETLKTADLIILEERKEGSAFLRSHGISGKDYEQLNEHSTKEDLQTLLVHCQSKKVALITDCGTPGFADPGADLVRLCREQGVPVHSLPGASSLMTLLSLSGRRIDNFTFRGFLSAETELRQKQWLELSKNKSAIILMDTPYRLQKTLSEVAVHFSTRRVLLGIDLTQETEKVLEALGAQLPSKVEVKKAEFILMIYPA